MLRDFFARMPALRFLVLCAKALLARHGLGTAAGAGLGADVGAGAEVVRATVRSGAMVMRGSFASARGRSVEVGRGGSR